MEFRVDCACGGQVVVTEGAAGSSRLCTCGRAVPIPSLKELRLAAGLPAYHISPEAMIEHLLATGELPAGTRCGQCGCDTSDVVHVTTVCERGWSQADEGPSLWGLILLWAFLPLGLWWFLTRRGETREYGSDKIYSLPLRVCAKCQATLGGAAALKQCLRSVPAYDRLLEKFPDAEVTVAPR